MKEMDGVDLGALGDRLSQMGQADQQQKDEGDGCQQRVEGQGAGEERDIVFICCLQRTAEKTGGRMMPPAGPGVAQASGSSRSVGDRRRARASARRRSSSSRGDGLLLRP
jgi:hypothetical protein